jgi:hypothetical protein
VRIGVQANRAFLQRAVRYVVRSGVQSAQARWPSPARTYAEPRAIALWTVGIFFINLPVDAVALFLLDRHQGAGDAGRLHDRRAAPLPGGARRPAQWTIR